MVSDQAQRHFRQARRLLAVVEARAEVELPEVTAPTACHSMRHAATAVLVAHGTASPRTHRGVLSRPRRLEREQAWRAEAEVDLLNRAFRRRLIADHGAAEVLTTEHALSARDEATAFVLFCERKMEAV
jgi:uncharacterized protein (UPF0332 family)